MPFKHSTLVLITVGRKFSRLSISCMWHLRDLVQYITSINVDDLRISGGLPSAVSLNFSCEKMLIWELIQSYFVSYTNLVIIEICTRSLPFRHDGQLLVMQCSPKQSKTGRTVVWACERGCWEIARMTAYGWAIDRYNNQNRVFSESINRFIWR